MSKRAASLRFPEVVQERFGFLVAEMGFLGPEFHSGGAFFYLPRVSIEVLYVERDRCVMTFANGMVADRHLRAELSCMYVRAGLGPAQRIGWSAGTSHALKKALDGQAVALRELLPRLTGDARDDLLLNCHAR